MNRKAREFREATRQVIRACRDAIDCIETAQRAEGAGNITDAIGEIAQARLHAEYAGFATVDAGEALRGRRDTRGRHDRLADKTTIAAAVSADVKPLFRDSVESAAP